MKIVFLTFFIKNNHIWTAHMLYDKPLFTAMFIIKEKYDGIAG